MMKVSMLAMPLMAFFLAMSARTQPSVVCILLGISQIALLAALLAGYRRMRRGRATQRRVAVWCVALAVIVVAVPFRSHHAVEDLLAPGNLVPPLASAPSLSTTAVQASMPSTTADPVGLPDLPFAALANGIDPLASNGLDDTTFFTSGYIMSPEPSPID